MFESGDQVSAETQSRIQFSPSGAENPSIKETVLSHKRKIIFCNIKEKKTMLQLKHKEEGTYEYKVS